MTTSPPPEIRWLCKPMHVRRAAHPSGSRRKQRPPRAASPPRCLGAAGRRPSPVTMAPSPNVREVAPMPGSNDQLADMPPGTDPVSRREPDPVGPRESDPVSPREPDPIMAELQERMERLPHGHPSSPYNDDGSRKPPLPDLSDYELPIPGDPDYRPEPSRASEADRPETAQTSEHVTPGTNPDEGPERTADRTELSEVPPDAEPHTDAENPGHAQEVRERPDQAWAWGLAPDEEDTPDVRGEVSHEEREAFHDAPADDLDERTANELPIRARPRLPTRAIESLRGRRPNGRGISECWRSPARRRQSCRR